MSAQITTLYPLLAFVLVGGCGRVGFEPFGSQDANPSADDGAMDVVDASLNDSGVEPDAGMNCGVAEIRGTAACSDGVDNDCDMLVDQLDPGCDTSGCLIVTTEVDEDDGGESATPPHLGAGLSLREAIQVGNASAGADCIVFDSAMTIVIDSVLPAATDTAGLRIDGAEQVTLADSGTAGEAIKFEAGPNRLMGMRLIDFLGAIAIAVEILSDDSIVGPNVEMSNVGTGVSVIGERVGVTGNYFHDVVNQAVQVKASALDLSIEFNVFQNNAEGVQSFASTGMVCRHNTYVGNARGINFVLSGADVTVENNLFVGHTDTAVDGVDVTFLSLDFNDFFNNATDCNSCAIGDNSITTDPLLANPAAGDFRLSPGSLAIDKGTDTGLDTNGGSPGLFNGQGPDLGAIESP